MEPKPGSTRIEEQIGRLLVEGGFINQEQLADAKLVASQENSSLRAALIAKGYLAEETYSTFLSIQMRVPLVDLRQVIVEAEAVNLVPDELARQYSVLPLGIEGDTLRVAMDDPQDVEALNALSSITGYTVKARLPAQGSVRDLIDKYYKNTPRIEQELESILGTAEVGPRPSGPAEIAAGPRAFEAPAETSLLTEELTRAPVVKALDMLINQAVRDRASDIHIEPSEESVRIRYRIDGVLQQAAQLPIGIHSALVSRIKVMAGMDIAERRRPQDGHFSLNVNTEDVDFRVASIETAYGEKVVVRVLNKTASVYSLSELGFLPNILPSYEQLLHSPYGMVMISGPTGSGKTTTLYASLQTLDTNRLNILTVEDPIEYHFSGVNQVQVNEQAGITFAGGLRAMMRMDPDVILVGEIRDRETANVAVQAALTGHLVLTSIHANDAASAIIRLIDLGVEPFLVTSAVIGSIAQRLVRKVCPYCKTLAPVSPVEAAGYQLEMEQARTDFYVGRGCNMCARSSYMGRIGVYEVLTMNDPIRKLVQQGATAEEIKAEALRNGMFTMRRDGMIKARDGITTPHEVMRNVFSII